MAMARPLRPPFAGLARATMSDADEGGWGALMVAAQSGNGGAYRRLLSEVRIWLVRYFARRLPPSLVDDAAQDTLIAIHEKRHTYDPSRPFRPWLTAIARYKWIDRLRAMGRQATEPLPDDIAQPDHESAVTSATVLRQLLAELKPPQAEAIRLVKIEGLSVEETSARTGQSASLVKVNIHRGLARLAAIVQGQSHGD
jgi:RNA polymerase sigma factor (sigma-70 family)